jgi:hypothetical protein
MFYYVLALGDDFSVLHLWQKNLAKRLLVAGIIHFVS